jgi:hypothetical protein
MMKYKLSPDEALNVLLEAKKPAPVQEIEPAPSVETENWDELDRNHAPEVFDPLPNVPEEMKQLPQWLTWGGDPTKKQPFISGTQNAAHTDVQSDLVDYQTAAKNIQLGKGFKHLGFVPTGDILGLDIDVCRDPKTGEIAPWANQLLAALPPTYTEVTPSETGLRPWLHVPGLDRRKIIYPVDDGIARVPGDKAPQVELLTRNYGTVTGVSANHARVLATITLEQWAAIEQLLATWKPKNVSLNGDRKVVSGLVETYGVEVDGPGIPRGKHDNTLFAIGCSLRARGAEYSEVEERLIAIADVRCESRGPDYVQMAKKCAIQACKYPKGVPSSETVIMGQTDADKKVEADKEEILIAAIRAARPDLDAAWTAKRIMVQKVGEESKKPEPVVELVNHIPSSAFTSTRLSDIYMEIFEPNEWPLQFALPALVTAASVVVPPQPRPESGMLIGEDPMVTLFTGLIAEVNAGKSQMMNWASRAVGIRPEDGTLGTHYYEGKWGSGEQMLMAVQKKQSTFTNKSVMLVSDELSHLFAKAMIEGASFPKVLDSAFYARHHNFTLGGTGGGREYNLNVAMSLIGGIVEDEFDTVFGAGTLGGLYDRFLFGRVPKDWKWDYRPYPFQENQNHWSTWGMTPVKADASVWEATKPWKRKYKGLGRISELCIRVATTFAAADGRSILTGKDIEPLEPLAAYQWGIRQQFKPNAGANYEAIFANKALAWINEHAEWASIYDLKQDAGIKRTAEKVGPVVVLRTLRSLAFGGDIDMWEARGVNPPPSDYTGPQPRIGLIRRAK